VLGLSGTAVNRSLFSIGVWRGARNRSHWQDKAFVERLPLLMAQAKCRIKRSLREIIKQRLNRAILPMVSLKEVKNVNQDKCAQCGTPASPGAKFCESCGAPLTAVSTPFTAATQAMQPSAPATKLKEITYVPVVQVAKVVGAIDAVIFFIIGIFTGLIAGASVALIPGTSGLSGIFWAILVIIVYPIIGFIAGFVGTAIAAIIYNWIVPRIGGIQVQVK
jgi:hypothetical protein